MKNHHHRAALAALLILAGCAGTTTRDRVLLPAIAGSWADVRVQVLRELGHHDDLEGRAAVAEADAAIAAGAPAAVAAVRWPLLEELAEADVARRLAAGEIGPGVATSLRGRLADLAEARALYTRAPR